VAAAIVKGAVLGVAYFLTGVPHPLLFTMLTMALALGRSVRGRRWLRRC
jgi:predicted PurR-regulated permease PerM